MRYLVVVPCLMAQASSFAAPGDSIPEWQVVRETVNALATLNGTASFFKKNPRMASNYGEEAFLQLIQKWQAFLSPLPVRQADLDPDVAGLEVRQVDDRLLALVTFHDKRSPGKLVYLKLTWEDSELVKIDFYRGFVPSGQTKGDSSGGWDYRPTRPYRP